jgi:Skp family chaperone for outer membrane proteins
MVLPRCRSQGTEAGPARRLDPTYLGEIAVKKLILCLTGLAVLASGAYFSSYLFAQGTGTATQQAGTKVAVINIGHVFNNYIKAQGFKKELEAAFAPYKDKIKRNQDQIVEWQKQLQSSNLDPKQREFYESSVRKNKRELEDWGVEMQRLLGKRQEDNLVQLWREVNLGIQKVSEAYGFQIVLGYGDPLDKELLHLFPNINRKMGAMDNGGAVPLYIHGSIDLSHAVTETLNRWEQQRSGVAPTGVQPVGGQK